MKFIKILFTGLFLFIAISISAKTSFFSEDEEHLYLPYEIGISNGVVYTFSEEKFTYGVHLHFIKKDVISRKIGFGVGYEAIFDEHGHNALSVILHYTPVEHFSMNISPGIVFIKSEPDQSRFALHTEFIYDFIIGVFHIGPLIGAAVNPEDLHASVGLHMAIDF